MLHRAGNIFVTLCWRISWWPEENKQEVRSIFLKWWKQVKFSGLYEESKLSGELFLWHEETKPRKFSQCVKEKEVVRRISFMTVKKKQNCHFVYSNLDRVKLMQRNQPILNPTPDLTHFLRRVENGPKGVLEYLGVLGRIYWYRFFKSVPGNRRTQRH